MRRLVMATTSGGRSSYFRSTAYLASAQAAVSVGAASTFVSCAAADSSLIRLMNMSEQRVPMMHFFTRFPPSCFLVMCLAHFITYSLIAGNPLRCLERARGLILGAQQAGRSEE